MSEPQNRFEDFRSVKIGNGFAVCSCGVRVECRADGVMDTASAVQAILDHECDQPRQESGE